MIYKQCSHHSCSKLVEYGTKYCHYHQEQWDKENKKRYKEYNQRRMQDDNKKKAADFYNSKSWKMLRGVCISDCYGIDIVEFYRTGNIINGETVHHIISIEEDWDNRLDISNLIYISEQTHRIIHAEMDKGKKEKEAMQRMLFGLLDRFNKEFI